MLYSLLESVSGLYLILTPSYIGVLMKLLKASLAIYGFDRSYFGSPDNKSDRLAKRIPLIRGDGYQF